MRLVLGRLIPNGTVELWLLGVELRAGQHILYQVGSNLTNAGRTKRVFARHGQTRRVATETRGRAENIPKPERLVGRGRHDARSVGT